MEFKLSPGQLFDFMLSNWFKLTVVALCLYIYLGKDFSFNLQVHVPEIITQPEKPSSNEKMTDASNTTAHVDKLEMPSFWGNSKEEKRNASVELAAVGEGVKHAYLKRFANVAVQEQDRFGIPASVILATAMYQSTAGEGDVTTQSENHFALLCDSEWRSACKSVDGVSYRKYESAWASFRDFSQYANRHFSNLKGSDYRSWAMSMQKSNLFKESNFAKTLIEIIEGYRLQEMDK